MTKQVNVAFAARDTAWWAFSIRSLAVAASAFRMSAEILPMPTSAGTVEPGMSGCEELLRVRTCARTAHLLARVDDDFEVAIVGGHATVTADASVCGSP